MNFLMLIKDMPKGFEIYFNDPCLFHVYVLCYLDEGFEDVVVGANGEDNVQIIEGEIVLL